MTTQQHILSRAKHLHALRAEAADVEQELVTIIHRYAPIKEAVNHERPFIDTDRRLWRITMHATNTNRTAVDVRRLDAVDVLAEEGE